MIECCCVLCPGNIHIYIYIYMCVHTAFFQSLPLSIPSLRPSLSLSLSSVRFEFSAIFQALRLASNSMTCEAADRLEDFAGFAPPRLSIYTEVPMIRAACKTFELRL